MDRTVRRHPDATRDRRSDRSPSCHGTRRLPAAALALGLLTLVGCGSGGEDLPDPDAVAELATTWCGPAQDGTGNLGVICVVIDNDGVVETLEFNGADAGGEGVIERTAHPDVFRFTLEGGLEGVLALSTQATHVMYLDENRVVGALDSTSSSLPSYARTNIRGTWAGYSWTVDDDGNPSTGPTATLDVDSSYEFFGEIESDDYFNQPGAEMEIQSTAYGLSSSPSTSAARGTPV